MNYQEKKRDDWDTCFRVVVEGDGACHEIALETVDFEAFDFLAQTIEEEPVVGVGERPSPADEEEGKEERDGDRGREEKHVEVEVDTLSRPPCLPFLAVAL